MNDDLSLLRRYEPVVHYTLGELYFPCAVDEYVERCSLWLRPPDGAAIQLRDWGELTLDKLADYREIPDRHSLYMRFVDRPMDVLDYGRWRLRPDRPPFYAKGRLARVGIFPRIIDSFFDLSLLIRGTVPGGTTAAADIRFQDMRRTNPQHAYYGRIVRIGGYTVLHYFFFYAMNDWRSSFYGVNDHESDWEQIFVYLSGKTDHLTPRWVAYASHDYEGDNLRRRWDDPGLQRVDGTHPVVYAGAGSHASYFQPGEYMMSVEPSPLHPIQTGLDWISSFWSHTLGQGADNASDEEPATHGIVSIPFVDYARGDGYRIGPAQDEEWSPQLLSGDEAWVNLYRGLWGLDTSDPFSGERAPSGPKYNRDGSVRKSWYDPLGWAGLDKVTPPEELIPDLENQIAELRERGENLDSDIRRQRDTLRRHMLEVDALKQSEFVSAIQVQQQENLEQEEAALNELYASRISTQETRIATESYLEKVRAGDFGDPQAHITNQHKPEPPVTHLSRASELWSAVSGGLLLLLVAGLVILIPAYWVWWLIGIVFVFFALEATARGYLSNYLLNVSILLAIVSVLILFFEFWWLAILGAIVGLVVFMIRENLRELHYSQALSTVGAIFDAEHSEEQMNTEANEKTEEKSRTKT